MIFVEYYIINQDYIGMVRVFKKLRLKKTQNIVFC